MSSHDAYHLRKALLEQAQAILHCQYKAKIEAIHVQIDANKRHAMETPTILFPVAPTTEEIIVEAKKLYEFIKTK